MRILVVRLTSLGDVVHTIPVVAALRRARPDAQIDWLVDERYRELVQLVPVVDRAIVPRAGGSTGWGGLTRVVRQLRASRCDVALDLQGLLKSAALAWLSGAGRVIGFEPAHLREPWARWMYTETPDIGQPVHVIEKNLALAASLGARSGEWEFPIDSPTSALATDACAVMGLKPDQRFALINPGSVWASKRWAPERFGALAQRLLTEQGLRSAVVWGPGEDARAQAVVTASSGAALLTPPTSVTDLVALAGAASVVVSGDTGPLHIAAAVQTPVVAIYGPSDPCRNGPWADADVVVSCFEACACQRARSGSGGVVVRRCEQTRPCLDAISVDDVANAVARRLRAVTHA